MKNRLKEMRENAHLSQKGLGNLVGISQQVISRIERDGNTMTLEHLLILSSFFNVSTDYLLGKSQAKRNLEEQGILLDRIQEQYDLVQIFRTLDEDYQQIVWGMMEIMAERLGTKNKKESGH